MNLSESSEHDEQLARLLGELTDAAQRGETVDLAEVCAEHPTFAEELRLLWGAVMFADAAGSDRSAGFSSAASIDRWQGLKTPCLIDDYELLEEIGRGGMGVVYRARQESLNREVAVKMILRGELASTADLERFYTEAQAAARLDHHGIVPVYEVGELGGHSYFSMKYIEGSTLLQLLATGPLPPREAARLIAAVAKAIHFAHQQGVLHRDLKPSNILLDEHGQPHVTDFGLAKQATDQGNLTRTGAVLGTPSYMSPEQANGVRDLGPATDVYSLGAMLYHALAGRPPFQAATPLDTILLLREQEPVPPRVLNPQANRDLEMIALRCLQKPSDLRYRSADDLARDLEAFLNDEPIAARSGRFSHVIARMFRETHHAVVLENWGLLWMWHSLAIFVACLLTNVVFWIDMQYSLQGVRYYYFALWTAGFGAWAAVFWALRRRMGPVLFVERQIAHVWAASIICIAMLFPLEAWLSLEPLKLSPILGLINGMVFFVKAGILSGAFYLQSLALFLTAVAMALAPEVAHLIFGAVSAACFFFPGLKYYRQRMKSQSVR
ncbi:serine/threonine-protein kinase [Lignipirellula cremea]|uniref:non-specific serine/threonine protein kinase n=1 Tax=Lignipirellula cremea TaxID=2528010 RepID=A0A518DTZ2_9BACT|nr:serine/threonine-protein kinase [Lignipirellula cremea]QDU95299.1 Serine/threonine-protein kinase PknB [Lignipirellula cremea]